MSMENRNWSLDKVQIKVFSNYYLFYVHGNVSCKNKSYWYWSSKLHSKDF